MKIIYQKAISRGLYTFLLVLCCSVPFHYELGKKGVKNNYGQEKIGLWNKTHTHKKKRTMKNRVE